MMLSYNEIEIGDIFSNPLFEDNGIDIESDWVVIGKNDDKELIHVAPMERGATQYYAVTAVWRESDNKMFNESWRVN